MGTVHQLRWDRPRGRPLARMPRKFLARRSDALLFVGVFIVAAAIGANALGLWHAPDSTTHLMGSVHVVDGDSLKAGDEQIRLLGIDAPELRQTCRDAQGRQWQCGRAAKTRLAELVSKGDVACTSHGKDRYGRTLAVCSAGNIPDVSEVLVREGYAVNFALSSSGYPAAERDAQSARRGLWQGEFERPQDWRRRHPRAE
jgi:endonuclease YncB( thermonuclease family)